MRFRLGVLVCIGLLLGLFFACSSSNNNEDKTIQSSRAYSGHEDDADINHFVKAYPATIGTRLDDCQTCHTGEKDAGGVLIGNPCDYCHDLMVYGTGHTYAETLNAYGADYMAAGRDVQALKDIKNTDSDGDTYVNKDEIEELRYPGYEFSKPDQPLAPTITVGMSEIKDMTSHSEFILQNTKKQQFDFYATYKGVTLPVLFEALGIDTTGATGVTIIAPDGFTKSFTSWAQIDDATSYPQPLYYANLDVLSKGADCGFVEYPENLPDGLTDTGAIPGNFYVTIAYQRDGDAMESCYYDTADQSIEGEGPYRLIVPQSTVGSPDRGQGYSPTTCGDGFDYDAAKDHNAGSSVRGVTVIRIDPMPAGYEEFDYMNGGWAYIDTKEIVVYGYGVNP